jgi:hypothetical protein
MTTPVTPDEDAAKQYSGEINWDGDRIDEINDAIALWADQWGLQYSGEMLDDATHAVARIFIPR